MKRFAVLLAAAMLTLSLSGLTFGEEAKPAEVKKDAAAEAKPAKKDKKKKAVKKEAVKKDEAAKAEPEKKDAAKPAPKKAKKKEAAGC